MENDWVVSHWMSKSVFTVKPKDPIVDAFELMRVHRIRHVPVVEKGRLVASSLIATFDWRCPHARI